MIVNKILGFYNFLETRWKEYPFMLVGPCNKCKFWGKHPKQPEINPKWVTANKICGNKKSPTYEITPPPRFGCTAWRMEDVK